MGSRHPLLRHGPLYGAGLGERRVGGLLAGRPRASFRLSTKVGWLAADGACHIDYGRQATVDGLMASLDRLGVDRVDIAYIHDLDPYNHGDAAPARFREAMAGAYPALAELRRAGRVGAIGIGVNDPDVCLAALDHGDFDLFLMAGRYTLIDQGAAGRLLPACLVRGARVVVGHPSIPASLPLARARAPASAIARRMPGCWRASRRSNGWRPAMACRCRRRPCSFRCATRASSRCFRDRGQPPRRHPAPRGCAIPFRQPLGRPGARRPASGGRGPVSRLTATCATPAWRPAGRSR